MGRYSYEQEPGQHHQQADDHGEGVVEQHAALQVASNAGQETNRFGRTVYKSAINHIDVPFSHNCLPILRLPPANTAWLKSSKPYLLSSMRRAQPRFLSSAAGIDGAIR